MLQLRNIHKTFNAGSVNEKHALCGLNLHLNAGDFATVIGGNGAGKSTMLAHGNRLIMLKDGQIILDISGPEKQNLTVENLLAKFAMAAGEELANDRMLLS